MYFYYFNEILNDCSILATICLIDVISCIIMAGLGLEEAIAVISNLQSTDASSTPYPQTPRSMINVFGENEVKLADLRLV